MKKSPVFLICICLLMTMAGCRGGFGQTSDGIKTRTDIKTPTDVETQSDIETQSETTITEEKPNMLKIKIQIGNEVYSATLYDGAAAKAFVEMLPLTLNMSELNGNEKYFYLNTSLPASASRPSGIEEGDLMLYGDSCLVLFYESFSTSYTYTPIGRIDDPSGLAAALGSGSVQVTFRQG